MTQVSEMCVSHTPLTSMPTQTYKSRLSENQGTNQRSGQKDSHYGWNVEQNPLNSILRKYASAFSSPLITNQLSTYQVFSSLSTRFCPTNIGELPGD